ncbi:MAG TPA: RsmE family RNA methyltransferase [Planctomycetota bacterium]|nr:RsmE family RNA methyltransferase [Planctomycetota bacterium]
MAQRYFVPSLPPPGQAAVTGDLAHHLGRVLRVQPGTPVLLGDGQGGTAAATVLRVGRTEVELEVQSAVHRPRPPCVEVAFAPPRLHRAEWLFEHGTEVGISAFRPLWTTRTRPQGERPERWQRIVRAAAGQCDRDWLPEVHAGCELADFLRSDNLPRRRFLASAGAPPLLEVKVTADPVLLLVGPEGGFTDEEAAAARASGFEPRGLGPHTLRTETAALVGAAILLAP